MASKLKADVRINDNPEVCDFDLELTPDQSVVMLENVMAGLPVIINLLTPKNGHVRRDTPEAYAS